MAVIVVLVAAGCSSAPAVITESPPHYAIIVHSFGMMDSEYTTRIPSDEKAEEVCRGWGRVAKLPAKEAECAAHHMLLRYCMGYKYLYECEDD